MPRQRLNGAGPGFLRYILVGASVNAAGYSAYLLLTWAGLSPHLAVTVLLPVSLWSAFRLHGSVTFSAQPPSRTAGIRYLAVSLSGYALNLAMLTALVEGAGIPHQVAQLGSIAVVAPAMFLLMQRFVFPDRVTRPPTSHVTAEALDGDATHGTA